MRIKPCEDPLVRILFKRFGYKVVCFWIACNAAFVLASLYHGTLINMDFETLKNAGLSFESSADVTLVPLLKDANFYIFFVLGSCGIILIDQALKAVPSTFADLWLNKVIIGKTEKKIPVRMYNEQLQEVEKRVNSKKSYVYAAVCVLISSALPLIGFSRIPKTESSIILYTDFRFFPLNGIVVHTVYAILYFLLIIMVYKGVVLTHFLRKLDNTFDFQVRPLHPDGCGGLKPVGNFCIAVNYIIFIFFAVIVAAYIFPHSEQLYFSLYFGLPLYTFLATFFFFYPIWPIYNSMKTQKYDLLGRLNESLDPAYRRTLEDIINRGVSTRSEALEKMERIDKIYERVHKMPIWPFEVDGLIWFLVTVLIPAVSVIAVISEANVSIQLFTTVFIPASSTLANVLLRGK